MKISTVFNRFYWNRMILNAYWSIFIIYIIAQILVYILGGKPEQYSPLYDYFIPYMILPDTLLILLLILLELLYRYQWRYAEEAILAGAFTISIIMTICIGPFIHGYLCIMILPLLISLISFHKKFLYVSFPLALLAIIFVPLLDATKRGDISIFEQILAGSIIVGTFVTSTGIIKRGYELLNHLERSMNSEQELLIQSVIMDRLSKTDALTDLYNHKTFHEYMERLIENQAIEPSPVALAVMDIDNFKQVNDTYGHWVGDLVLKEVAALIKEGLTPDDFAARYGGEEFVVLVAGECMENIRERIEEIRRKVEAMQIEPMDGRRVTISIGLHLYHEEEDKECFFRIADAALYQAKHNGKNQTVMG